MVDCTMVGMKKLFLVYAGFLLGAAIGLHYTNTHAHTMVLYDVQETAPVPTTTTAAPTTTVVESCAPGASYPDGWYTGAVPNETAMPDPDHCPNEYRAWVERETVTPKVVHCVAEHQDGFTWTQGDPNYTTTTYNGRRWACIGTTPQAWLNRPGVAKQYDNQDMVCYPHPMVRGDLCVPPGTGDK